MAVATDNFNRPNTAPGDLGPNWNVIAPATLSINSQTVYGKGKALFTLIQTETSNQIIAGLIRINTTVPLTRRAAFILRGSNDSGYLVGIEANSSSYWIVIWKRLLGVLTELDRSGPYNIIVGNDILIRGLVQGGGIKIVNPYNNTILAQASDNDISGPGYCGIDMGVDVDSDIFSIDNFFFQDLIGPTPPYRPILTVDNITTECANLTGTPFYDADLDTHAATQYQITLESDSNFANPVFDITILQGQSAGDTELLSRQFCDLEPGTCYKSRIRYLDSGNPQLWSDWSPIVKFCTAPEFLPVARLLHSTEKYEVSCPEAPERYYRYSLVIQEQIQQVYVGEIETPDGIYAFGDLLPFCVIDDIHARMLDVRARWGITVSDCAAGRIEIPFTETTPRPITVEHNCGKYPIVQIVQLDPSVGYPYPGPYNPYSPSPYSPGPYHVADEVNSGFPGEPSAEGVWVRHNDENSFTVHTTVGRGVIIAIFR